MSVILRVPSLRFAQFSKSTLPPDITALCADMSDLGWRAGEMNVSRIYDDAVDVGIGVEGEHGECVVFAFSHWATNVDGDCVCADFRPTKESVREWPYLANYRIYLYND